MKKFVSVIIPIRNEVNHIAKLVELVNEQDYGLVNFEIIIVDGESDDGTKSILENLNQKYPNIMIYSNPNKTVPYALNIGINESKGEIIIRMDAHSYYPYDYISELIRHLEELNCDNVGGVCITTPSNRTIKAIAIAQVTSNSFGIGNSQFRLNISKITEVDTVPFGCYKKEVFDKIGLFDEQLIRNQDDEFNARLKQNGGKIFLIPTIKIIYLARKNFTKLYNMFYQYGLFKPLVNKKIKIPSSYRQFAPLIFVLYLFLFPISILLDKKLFYISLIPITLYLLLNFIVSVEISVRKANFKLFPYLAVGFFLTHFSYGFGY